MKVTLDTNVLIAAFIARGVCAELFECLAQHHTLVESPYILNELIQKLTQKFGYAAVDARRAVRIVGSRANLVKPSAVDAIHTIEFDDLPILGTALAGRVDCLLTGDKALLGLKQFTGIPILPPARFWWFEERRNR